MKLPNPFLYSALTFYIFFTPLLILAQNGSDLLGVWITPEGLGHVKIMYDVKSKLYEGEIVWLKNPTDSIGRPVKDDKGNTVIHLKILKGFRYDDGQWVDGTIYDPETCKKFYCSMELANDSILEVHGSIDIFGLIGRTEIWKRIPKNNTTK